jgi:probable FeS assembly SUF system protein SufT
MTNHLYTPIALLRACAATVIPGGQKIALAAGEQVTITQALGGTFTVTTDSGYLARIAAKDADALGLERSDGGEVAASEATGGEPVEPGEFDLAQVIEQLKTVFDPEIPVNVVDLGLVYGCEARPLVDGRQRVEIQMSMTAPGCGMGDVLAEDARVKVAALPGVAQVEIELVWDPPWDMSRMSDAARLQLGM